MATDAPTPPTPPDNDPFDFNRIFGDPDNADATDDLDFQGIQNNENPQGEKGPIPGTTNEQNDPDQSTDLPHQDQVDFEAALSSTSSADETLEDYKTRIHAELEDKRQALLSEFDTSGGMTPAAIRAKLRKDSVQALRVVRQLAMYGSTDAIRLKACTFIIDNALADPLADDPLAELLKEFADKGSSGSA